MKSIWKIACLTSAAMVGAPVNAADLKPKAAPAYLMDRTKEISLARTAGPNSVSKDARILILQKNGDYDVAVEGGNGWTCMVTRAWSGPAAVENGRRVWTETHFKPDSRAPQCFNKESESSLVAMHRLSARLFMNGATPAQVDAMTAQALVSGDLQPPEPGAMSYMLSRYQVLGPKGENFRPHLMLYTPFATAATYGGDDEKVRPPFVTDAGTVWAVTVIMEPKWSDGTPAESQ